MRYLIINYIRRPNGQMDEIVSVSKKTKYRDLSTASVILDFKSRGVVKCSMDGVVVPRDWDRITGYYYQHYRQLIKDLLEFHGHDNPYEAAAPAETATA